MQNFTIVISPAPVAPTITSAPPPATGTVGAAYYFTVTATGTAPITFTATGLPPGLAISSGGVISGTPTTAGTYNGTITAANAALPNATQNFTIVISPAQTLAITIVVPTNGEVLNGPVSFPLFAELTPSNTVAVVEFFQDSTSVGSLSAPPFALTMINAIEGVYSYTARATDSSGNTVTSAPVMVTVIGPALPTGPSEVNVNAPDPLAFEIGPDPGTFQITRTGDLSAPLTVYYLLGGTTINAEDYVEVPTSVTIPAGVASADVTILPIFDADSPPEITDVVMLHLTAPPNGEPGYTIGAQGTAVVTINEVDSPPDGNEPPVVRMVSPRNGARITFRGTASGAKITLVAEASDPDGTVASVEFFAGGASLGLGTAGSDDDDECEEHESSSRYTLRWRGVAPGFYVLTAMATDNLGATTISAPVMIEVVGPAVRPPTITTQPVSQTVNAGATVTFRVVAAGTAPLTYQWRRNGVNIPGATSATLTLANVTTANAGSYRVIVRNSAGSVTSTAATLSVIGTGSLAVVLTSPVNGAVFTEPAHVVVTASVSPGGDIARVRFYDGTSLVGTDSTAPYSITTQGLGSGRHVFTAWATTFTGTTAVSAPVQITVRSGDDDD
jgi:hypothetical protein